MAYKALDIAKKLIRVADLESASGGDGMTNQKFLDCFFGFTKK